MKKYLPDLLLILSALGIFGLLGGGAFIPSSDDSIAMMLMKSGPIFLAWGMIILVVVRAIGTSVRRGKEGHDHKHKK